MSEADSILVEKVKGGDTKAFEILVRKYQGRVASIISRMVSDHGKIQDLVQEVFLKTYRSIDNFRGDSSFYTWLYRIAVNTAKNHYIMESRGVQLDSTIDITDDGEQPIPQLRENETPESRMLRSELLGILKKAIDELAPAMKMVIVLRELEGKTYEEIAAVMDCPIGTVRSRIFRGRQELAEKLKDYLDIGKV